MQQFTKAIVRKPGNNFPQGITSSTLGQPSVNKALEQHNAYCSALQKCELDVQVLDADESYPDGCFVEETAVITEDAAIITKPGDPDRLGEEKKIADVLARYKPLEEISLPGKVDGGDILRVGKHFYIGMSARTNEEGARQLSEILKKYGYTSSRIPVKNVLHLKTGVAYLGENTIIASKEFSDYFSSFNILELSPEEEYAANCLLINDTLLIPKGFIKSKTKISDLGYNIIELEMSEFRKMDGGLSCLSLLF
ncbi:MAG: dimethylarginine dimethylaminohydrolase family protein [Bacteroidales bacterium]